MSRPLDRIRIAGFKSIRDQTVELRPLNVLIGANGSGKSNFVGVFELLRALVGRHLRVSTGKAGGANRLLFLGRRHTSELLIDLHFDRNDYRCVLVPTVDDRFVFQAEVVTFLDDHGGTQTTSLGSGHDETNLPEPTPGAFNVLDFVRTALESWHVYHFHDTSPSAQVKLPGPVVDKWFLQHDARNLAALLYRIANSHFDVYRNIVDVIRLAAPFFDDFVLRPDPPPPGQIVLAWRARDSDFYSDAHALSDGTLRFICLAALLLQPKLPHTLLLDEPELGLHPYAIGLLADLLRSASTRTRVIVATQSVTLVDQFEADDLLIADRVEGASVFHRPSAAELRDWLEDYSLGDLWQRNVFGGRPTR